MENVIQIQYYQSPCGELILGAYREKLCLCDWKIEERRIIIDRRIQKELQASYKEGISEVITRTIGQLDEYFAGRRTTFDIPLLLVGTDFQKTVWNELLNIPYGKTISYAGLSQKVRVHQKTCYSWKILRGYGGGLPAKKILLDLESSDRLF